MLQEAVKIDFELHYFPCISQLASMAGAGNINFDPDAPFRRSTFRNRTIVLGPCDLIHLSVPVIGGRSVKSTYAEVKIDHSVPWQRDHFRTLQTAYGNSPFFFAYRDDLKSLYDLKKESLFGWNLICLEWFLKKSKLQSVLSIQIRKGDKTDDSMGKFLPTNFQSNTFEPFPHYFQVFNEKTGFKPNLSCLDLLFHLGPSTANAILSLADKQKLFFGV